MVFIKIKEKRAKRCEARNHNVYVLVDTSKGKKGDGLIEYAGRTQNLSSAETRHNNNVERSYLQLYPVATHLTYDAARGLEQIMLERCGTLYKEDKAFNQINGVSSKRKDIAKYYRNKALTWLDENEIPC